MNMKNTNFRLKEQCKGQQVETEQHRRLTENNVFLLCHSIKAKVEEQCFRPQSSPIFTIPPLCPSCHVDCGGCKGVSGGAEAFIKNALLSVT